MPSTADRMRKAANLMVARGLRVQYASGWENRSNGNSFNPTVGFIDHHTAATTDIDNVLINGRSDLPGPLCQWALHKDGTWVLIAAGGANHAGASVPGAPTNSTGWGCEATGPIPLDAYGPAAFPNYDAYVIGMACILEAENWQPSKMWGHKESASPLGRKIDPSFSMDTFRTDVGSGDTNTGDDDVSYNQWDDSSKKALVTDVVAGVTDNIRDYLLAYLGAGASNSVYNDSTVAHGSNVRSGYEIKASVHDEARYVREGLRRLIMAGAASSTMTGPAEDEVTLPMLLIALNEILDLLAEEPENPPVTAG